MRKAFRAVLFWVVLLLLAACSANESVDEQLQSLLDQHQVADIDPGQSPNTAKVTLGQALFFDKELSGNRDIACATCHHPTFGSGDGLSVSIGTGGVGLGPDRQIGYNRVFIPRNAPEVFNRGLAEWTSMFWDSRIAQRGEMFITPAGVQLPEGLDSVLAAQALFPITSGDEMRGASDDIEMHDNELAGIYEKDFIGIWETIMARLMSHPEYVEMFQAAYPDVPLEEINIAHVGNAIAAFEIDAYTFTNSPWQNYLNGDVAALSDEAKAGAVLFYGEAGCASCHSGSLMTNQQHYNLATPQVGPGKGAEAPLDLGRFRISKDETDLYAFRVPSLHNVAASNPYMHDGAFSTLEAAILHHLDPAKSLRNYDPSQHVPEGLWETFQDDPDLIADMIERMETSVMPERPLTNAEVQSLLAFLETLTDPRVTDLEAYVPDTVPSGLPVEDDLPVQDTN